MLTERSAAHGSPKRVRVFLDHWEFSLSYQHAVAELHGRRVTTAQQRLAQKEAESIRWETLPTAIMHHLEAMPHIASADKELRAIDVYASVSPTNNEETRALKTWFTEHLDRLPGFNVHQSERVKDRPEICGGCRNKLEPELEKGLKTTVACDLLSWAVEDLYDVGILVMDDPELIPSVMCVQEILDKQIIQIGLRDNGMQLRSAAWGHILLEDLLPDIAPENEWRQLYLARA